MANQFPHVCKAERMRYPNPIMKMMKAMDFSRRLILTRASSQLQFAGPDQIGADSDP